MTLQASRLPGKAAMAAAARLSAAAALRLRFAAANAAAVAAATAADLALQGGEVATAASLHAAVCTAATAATQLLRAPPADAAAREAARLLALNPALGALCALRVDRQLLPLQNCATCIAETSVAKASSAGKARQTDFMRAALMLLKASCMSVVQLRVSAPFLSPFNSVVRGRRIFATEGMNWQ